MSKLTKRDLETLREAFHQNLDEMAEILSAPRQYFPPVNDWLDEIGRTFYPEGVKDPPAGLALAPIDRERCLISILATRKERLNLAIHIYMGLMYGLSPAEVANTLALTGTYSGISDYIFGMSVAAATGDVLVKVAKCAGSPSPKAVITALALRFR